MRVVIAFLFFTCIVTASRLPGPKKEENPLSGLIDVVRNYQTSSGPLDEKLFYEKLSELLTKDNSGDAEQEHIDHELNSIEAILFSLLEWKEIIKPSDDPLAYLQHKSLELIADDVRKSLHKELIDAECPYSYTRVGNLCLSVDPSATSLTWEQARSHCQTTKRGDLAIFKDADDFASILEYVRKLYDEGLAGKDFWIGARDSSKAGWFSFINGERTPMGTPFWAVIRSEQAPTSHDEFAFLDGDEEHLLNAKDGTSANTIPLCMYYPNLYDAYLMGGYSESPQDYLSGFPGLDSFVSLYPHLKNL